MCSVKVKIVEPRLGSAPNFVSGVHTAYAFTSGHETAYNFRMSAMGQQYAPQQAIHAASKQLPAWAYHLAPKSVELIMASAAFLTFLIREKQSYLFTQKRNQFMRKGPKGPFIHHHQLARLFEGLCCLSSFRFASISILPTAPTPFPEHSSASPVILKSFLLQSASRDLLRPDQEFTVLL